MVTLDIARDWDFSPVSSSTQGCRNRFQLHRFPYKTNAAVFGSCQSHESLLSRKM